MLLTRDMYPVSPSNYNVFALFNMGWRDRPYTACEFGNIQAVNHTFIDYEGAFLDNFPARLGTDGVQNLTIQFESYDNQFWSDMNLMIDLVNVTQPGQLRLTIPDAGIPEIIMPVMPGDTDVFFYPGGILSPGIHTMTLSATGGLSMGMDAFNFTSMVPVPDVPNVTTAPVYSITYTSAVSGGNVTADGGASVTARGVCWSTLPNPTLLDNFTVDGSGLGIYSSLMASLLPSTTYYVRAYATNLAGTGYGNELSFTTWAIVPEFRTVQNVTVAAGQTECYDAINTITVAGGTTYFIVQPEGSATFVAGMKIRFLEGTRAFAGAYMHGYIDPTGTYCNSDAPVGPLIMNEEVAISYERSNFRLYPNPTTGDFTLEQKGATLYSNVQVEVYSMTGEKVLSDLMVGERKHEFRFSDIQPGIYFVKVVTSDYVETIKLLKAR
jgi:hypothetical protein